jgi:hypothetical protein
MKQLIVVVFLVIIHFTSSAQVGINNGNAAPASSAMLDVSSTNKGLLIPRMTTSQRKAIASPAVGLLVFDVEKFSLYMFDGQSWMALSAKRDADLFPISRMPNDPTNDKAFGNSVAISGDYAIVGGEGDSAAKGAAYIFFRNQGSWIMQAKLIADDGNFNDFFGASVDISGDYAIVGAFNHSVGANNGQGAGYIFFRTGTSWIQQAKISASDGTTFDNFGISVGISGDYAIVGAYQDAIGANTNQGSAYIFFRMGTSWTQQQKLTASDGAAGDYFGFDVAISGDYAIVGAYNHDVGANLNQGEAYIYVRGGGSWSQQSPLTCSDAGPNKLFGYSVSISGQYAAIGAYGDLSGQGSAYVFFRSGVNFTQQQKIVAFDGAASDNFGYAVAITQDYLLVGAPNDDIAFTNQGSVYLFKKNVSQWPMLRKIEEFNANANFNFGKAVSASLLNLIIGSPQNNNSGFSSAGSISFLNIDY